MDYLIRLFLLPFASFAAGAIVAMVLAMIAFQVSDKDVLMWFAVIGGVLAAAPSVIALFAPLIAPFLAKRRR